jgi:SAM-dependent methyltransferase
MLDREGILKRWYASIYEQWETGREDVECLLKLIGPSSLRVVEAACGGGRIAVPLAEAGHQVTGFDLDEAMLERAQHRAAGLKNIALRRADALAESWGEGFDVAVLGGNLLVNIETSGDYREAQQKMIQSAASCLAPGGHLFLDFDVPDWPDQSASDRREWVCFEGTDEWGTYGRYVMISGDYSRATRVDRSFRRYEIAPAPGEPFTVERQVTKYFPTLEAAVGWCRDAGFEVELLGRDYHMNPAGDGATRAVIWAKKRA